MWINEIQLNKKWRNRYEKVKCEKNHFETTDHASPC